MPKLSQVGALYRYHVIDDMLKFGRKNTVKQIIRALGGADKITDKMIRNDFDAIKALWGAEIVKDKTNRYFYSNESFSIKSFPINENDEIVLELATIYFQSLFTNNVTKKYNSAVAKILKGYDTTSNEINDNLKSEITKIRIIQPQTSNSKIGHQWIEPIFDSILRKNTIEIIYQKIGEEPQIKVISPYLLKEFKNHWYLIGYDNLTSKLTKVYLLDRINDLTISSIKYYTDPFFNIDNFFKYSFGIFHNYQEEPINIELEFYNTMIQQIINHPLMPNQKHKLIRNGKALRVEIQVYDSYEIIREILSYGSSVKVISPIELSEKIKSMIQKMIALYE